MSIAETRNVPIGTYDDRTVVAPTIKRKKPMGRDVRLSPQHDDDQASVSVRSSPVSPYIALNPLTEAASILLNLYVYLRQEPENPGSATLRDMVANEIRNFEEALDQRNYDRATILAARYCLCTVIDEAVMQTDQDKEKEWSRHSLLSMFHNETWGGEKFFQILSRLLLESRRHIDLLELLYVCLRLGFGGHYKASPNGPAKLDVLTENLYLTIRRERGVAEGDLSPDWKNGEIPSPTPVSRIPLRWIFLIAAIGLGIVYGFYYMSLQEKMTAIQELSRTVTPAIATTPAE